MFKTFSTILLLTALSACLLPSVSALSWSYELYDASDSPITVDFGYDIMFIDATLDDIVINVPDVSAAWGQGVRLKRVDNTENEVIVIAYSGQYIDGEMSVYLLPKQELTIVSSPLGQSHITGFYLPA